MERKLYIIRLSALKQNVFYCIWCLYLHLYIVDNVLINYIN